MIFCHSIYLKKVMKLLAFIFEQPSYLLTNERYRAYQTGFLFALLGHAQGWDLRVQWGVEGRIFLSEIQPDLVCELLT